MQAPWLDCCRSPVLIPGTQVHVMIITPVLLFVLWWSWWTFYLMLGVSAVMLYIQFKGRHPVWVIRRLQGRLRGDTVYCRPIWYRRRRTRLRSYDDIPISQGLVRPAASELALPTAEELQQRRERAQVALAKARSLSLCGSAHRPSANSSSHLSPQKPHLAARPVVQPVRQIVEQRG